MHIQQPQFQLAFLHPRYWGTWFSVALLYGISWLPYPLQMGMGKGIGRLFFRLLKSRRKVAERNLELAFPNMTETERQRLLRANFDNAGMALFEAGMGWWWPQWRLRKHGKITGLEHIQRIQKQGKGILAIAIHNMNIELNCTILGLQQPSVVFYRMHNNPLMEYFQFRGRSRANKYMIHKKGVREMIQALNDGEVCAYLPDQDYGPRRCEFVPFFGVKKTATTTGTLLFAKQADCETVFLLPLRTDKGYEIRVLPGLENFPSGDDRADLIRLNGQIEKMVLEAPEQYLWMHKRFKTRPPEEPQSLYQ
ncbi:Kdo(2)-lipid IV(A) lauroyltransferase [Saliniradius amylolyticus]|uniref:Lipid A biosynthesis acyltransferase n=1 Tax=Saliniradius amylolyticus TaxID=2183582 RepID=A0A2S2E5B0_9ALTE|nr:Kdo(2)-lipid IV(A) lauroyltransferase [Saliniradius amylolyticus]